MSQLSKDFKFKKQFGQNFIFDKNFLTSLVKGFNLDTNCDVLEIGAGAGVLTEVLAQNFKKVVSFEIDKTLTEHLQSLEKQYSNLKFVFMDVLKAKTEEIDGMFESGGFVLIANLPYYITSQIIFKFLFSSTKLSKMYVMVQKEVGERFCAQPSTKDYGIPTVLIDSFGECKIVKNVKRTMFTPVPNVDSCVIEIDLNRKKFNISNLQKYQDFVSNCFKMKRKTLYNNLSSFVQDKQRILDAMEKGNFQLNVRPENLTASDFVTLFDLIYR